MNRNNTAYTHGRHLKEDSSSEVSCIMHQYQVLWGLIRIWKKDDIKMPDKHSIPQPISPHRRVHPALREGYTKTTYLSRTSLSLLARPGFFVKLKWIVSRGGPWFFTPHPVLIEPG